MDDEPNTIRTDGEATRKVGKEIYQKKKKLVIAKPMDTAAELAWNECSNKYIDSYHRVECKDGVSHEFLKDAES